MKALIVEDEPAAARRLQKLIEETDPGISIAGHTDSIEATLDWLQQHPMPQLFFMDIHLADGACFEIFRRADIPAPVIFTTAYDQYALQAFKIHAVDYLLKPIKKEELAQAIQKLRTMQSWSGDYQALGQQVDEPAQKLWQRRFLIRFGQSIRVVATQEVAYFYTEDKISFLVTLAGKRYPIDFTLEQLEQMLDPALFFRINRQFILQLGAIKEMYTYSKSRIRIQVQPPSEQEIIVSTERAGKFKRWLVGS